MKKFKVIKRKWGYMYFIDGYNLGIYTNKTNEYRGINANELFYKFFIKRKFLTRTK